MSSIIPAASKKEFNKATQQEKALTRPGSSEDDDLYYATPPRRLQQIYYSDGSQYAYRPPHKPTNINKPCFSRAMEVDSKKLRPSEPVVIIDSRSANSTTYKIPMPSSFSIQTDVLHRKSLTAASGTPPSTQIRTNDQSLSSKDSAERSKLFLSVNSSLHTDSKEGQALSLIPNSQKEGTRDTEDHTRLHHHSTTGVSAGPLVSGSKGLEEVPVHQHSRVHTSTRRNDGESEFEPSPSSSSAQEEPISQTITSIARSKQTPRRSGHPHKPALKASTSTARSKQTPRRSGRTYHATYVEDSLDDAEGDISSSNEDISISAAQVGQILESVEKHTDVEPDSRPRAPPVVNNGMDGGTRSISILSLPHHEQTAELLDKQLLAEIELGKEPTTVVLIGGLAASPYLKSYLREHLRAFVQKHGLAYAIELVFLSSRESIIAVSVDALIAASRVL